MFMPNYETGRFALKPAILASDEENVSHREPQISRAFSF
jgi:hypothetical protein